MNSLDYIQKFGLEGVGRYYSRYRAIVIKNDDPENRQRLFVQVPSINNNVRLWALPVSQIGGVFYGAKFRTPSVGEIVWLQFEKGSMMRAYWSYTAWAAAEVPDELKPNNSIGLITPSGNKIILDDDNGTLSIRVGKKDSEEETTIVIDNGVTTVNGGKNLGLVNIESLRKFMTAVQQDLIVAQSGTKVSEWMAAPDGLQALEDTNFKH